MKRFLSFLPGVAILAGCSTSTPEPVTKPVAAARVAAPVTAAPAAPVDPLTPTLVAFPSGSRMLHGFLYKPAGSGPFPAIVFNHGSEKLPGPMTGQAQFYVPHGYALFVPHRRGHGRSQDAGEWIDKVANDPPKFVAELEAQEADVGAAVEFLAAQPFVDPQRVAVSGCSLGGIEALLAAAHETKIAAAIDFAGASMTWARMPPLQESMKKAARDAKVPVFFVQAENDFDTTPSKVLDAEMRAAKKTSQVHIYPPNGTTPMDGHHFCAGGTSPGWGPEVLQFLEASMKKR